MVVIAAPLAGPVGVQPGLESSPAESSYQHRYSLLGRTYIAPHYRQAFPSLSPDPSAENIR
ncbi:MAG: hypothetical protein QOF62_922 [Pyrinomonadaceae bacterium]|jgi:hypothetical protein|nr:hypothetical protein [Pyrinomonadaceae bacterium]